MKSSNICISSSSLFLILWAWDFISKFFTKKLSYLWDFLEIIFVDKNKAHLKKCLLIKSHDGTDIVLSWELCINRRTTVTRFFIVNKFFELVIIFEFDSFFGLSLFLFIYWFLKINWSTTLKSSFWLLFQSRFTQNRLTCISKDSFVTSVCTATIVQWLW